MAVSALKNDGFDELLTIIDDNLQIDKKIIDVEIPLTDGATIAWLYQKGNVLSRSDDDFIASFEVRLLPGDIKRLEKWQNSGNSRI